MGATLADGEHLASPKADVADAENQLISWMNRYERKIFTYLTSVLRDDDLALDCTQDTFIRAYHHLCRGRPVTAQWLYTVARNRAMDEFRRRRHERVDPEALDTVAVTDDAVDSAVVVQAIMDALPLRDRELLYLFEIAGFSTDEIGGLLGIRGSAVRQALSRARQRFRALCSDELR